MSLRIGVVGAVGSTEVTLRALAGAGHPPRLLLTLPLDRSARHSDFVELSSVAQDIGAEVMFVEDVNGREVLERLRALELDLLFVVGWSRICGPEFRAAAKIGAIGYHPTLLPKMRGRAALAWTILLGVNRTGGTLFWLDAGVDSGAVAAQEAFDLPGRVTLQQLGDLQMDALRRMISPLVEQLALGEVPALPQDHSQATYLAVRRPSHGEIDWSEPSESVERLVRAVSRPYPGAFTYHRGEKLLIWSADIARYPQWHAQVGQVFTYEGGSPVVRCGDDADLILTEYEFAPPEGQEATAARRLSGQPMLGR